MSVDKQDLIESEEQSKDTRLAATPRYSAYYDGPAVLSLSATVEPSPNPRLSIHENKRSSYTPYPQPTPFDDDGLTTSSRYSSLVDDPFSLQTESVEEQQQQPTGDQPTDQFASLLEPPTDYTVHAVIAAFFCLPCGVYAYKKANEAKEFYESGHTAAAVEASKKALRSARIGIALGCAVILPLIITTIVLVILL